MEPLEWQARWFSTVVMGGTGAVTTPVRFTKALARPACGQWSRHTLNRLIELRYARPDTGAYSAEQMDALRTQSTLLSSTSRAVFTTSDDDEANDHEVWAYDATGAEMLLTPDRMEIATKAPRHLSGSGPALDRSSTAGDVDGLTEPLPTLPGSLPAEARPP